MVNGVHKQITTTVLCNYQVVSQFFLLLLLTVVQYCSILKLPTYYI